MEEIDMFGNINDAMNLLRQLQNDPVSFAASKKFNIPQGMNDPGQIIQYLLNTGQVSQEAVNKNFNSPLYRQLVGNRQ
jgi:hypothetical protein